MLLKPTKIRTYLAAMRARGIGAAAVLRGAELSESQLQDPALLIEDWQRERVILNLLRLTGNPALGLELGAAALPVDFGVVAYAQMSGCSMREAFELWDRYSSAVGTTMPIHLEVRSGSDWNIVYDSGCPTDPVGWFGAEEMVAMAIRLGPLLAGPAFVLKECTFSYPPPPHWRRYAQVLGCTVRFNAKKTVMRPSSPHLDAPLPGHDPEFHAVCLRHLGQTIRQITREKPTSSRLRALLMSRPTPMPSLDAAAGYLGMSARSLRRHLTQERTSFQQIVDDVRLDLASTYLRAEQRPVKEVSIDLGFSSVSAFRRAFKNWTGQTVQQFLDAAEPAWRRRPKRP